MHNLCMSEAGGYPSIVTGWDGGSHVRRSIDHYLGQWRLLAITDGYYLGHGDARQRVGPGHVLIAAPGERSLWQATDGAHAIGIVFHMDQTEPPVSGAEPGVTAGWWGSPVQRLVGPPVATRIVPRLVSLASMWWLTPRHRVRANAVLSLILVDLLDAWDPPTGYSEPPVLRATNDQRVMMAEDQARSRLNRWTVADMAAAVGMERAAFTRLYTRERNRGPGAWLDAARLSLATSMLSGTDKPLTTIAAWCGHPRLQSFGRWFKARTQVSPAAFRRAAQGSLNG